MTDQNTNQPVIVIRRNPKRGIEESKGGVWKIAYADFMTAMMAFFLVMWLINATSESTQQGLANYFNPIMLSDAKIPKKGVRSDENISNVDARQEGEDGEGEGGPEASGAGGDLDAEQPEGGTPEIKPPEEEAIFRDPYAVLAAIGFEEGGQSASRDMGFENRVGGSGEVDRPGTEAFRDPFDPVIRDAPVEGDDDAATPAGAVGEGLEEATTDAVPDGWTEASARELADEETLEVGEQAIPGSPPGNSDGTGTAIAGDGGTAAEAEATAEAALPSDGDFDAGAEGGDGEDTGGALSEIAEEATDLIGDVLSRVTGAPAEAEAEELAALDPTDGEGPQPDAGQGPEPDAGQGPEPDAGAGARPEPDREAGPQPEGEEGSPDIAAQTDALRRDIAEALGGAGDEVPSVAVERVEEGVLISLTDDADFGMFAIGSAEPKRETVLTMARIAKVLKERGGAVIIRGHTDARPFRDSSYDNWRLSTARAHMAHYMLENGGFDTSRVERIEGRADRDLRRPEDPRAAENRRIEILLRSAE